MSTKVYLDAGTTFSNSNANVDFVGGTGTETVTLGSGATANTFNGNVEAITLTGASTAYNYLQSGNTLKIYSGTTLVATAEVQDDTNGSQLTFSNGTYAAKLTAGTSGPTMTIGTGAVSATTAGTVDVTGGTTTAGFTLTTATTDNLVGTSANEAFTGVLSSALVDGTLQATDKIDGGTGTDTATFSMSTGFTGFTTGSMKGVETVTLNNTTGASLAFDATGVTDVTKYVIGATKAAVTISNAATLADLEVTGNSKTAAFTLGYAATSVVNTGSQVDTQNLKTTDVESGTFTIAGVETLALNSAGTKNGLTLSGVDASTVTVTGSALTTITGGANVTSFDASAVTGKMTVGLTASAAGKLTTVKTGTTDDVVTIDAGDLKAGAVLAGGTGSDTLTLSGTGGTIQPTISGFETISASSLSSDLIFSGTNVTDVTAIKIGGSTGTALVGAQSFVNMGSGAVTVTSTGAQSTALVVDNSGAVIYNVNAGSAATSASKHTSSATANFDNASTLVVNAGGGYFTETGAISATNASSVTYNLASKIVDSVEQSTSSAVITAGGATSFTVNASGTLTGAAEISAAKATTGTVTTGIADSTLKITAAKATTLNLTANGNLAITGSTLTALQNLTVSTAGALTPTTVAMADASTLTLSGSTSKSSVGFGNLGSSTQTHSITVTATGLAAGVTTGNIDAGTSTVALNVTGATGFVTAGTVDADAGITVTATNTVGALTVGNMLTTTGSVSVDVSNASGAVTLGTMQTNAASNSATTGVKNGGDVTLLATNALGNVSFGKIFGNNVTVNNKGVLGTVTNAGITAGTSVAYTASNLQSESVAISASADSTALALALNGGSKNETFTVTGGAKTTGVTVTGDLGAGTNSVGFTMGSLSSSNTGTQTISFSGLTASASSTTTTSAVISNIFANSIDRALTYTGTGFNDAITLTTAGPTNIANTKVVSITDTTLTDTDTLTLNAAAGSISFTGLVLSGIEQLTIGDTSTVSINASAISGQTITLNGVAASDALTLTGTAGNDVISLSKITVGANTPLITVNLSEGNDTFIGSDLPSTVNVGGGTNTITLGSGGNTCTVTTGTGTGTNTITGGAGIDTIVGGNYVDTITGGLGADTITGGLGNDIITLTDTASADTYIFKGNMISAGQTANMDTITGLNSTDTITFGSTFLGLGSFSYQGQSFSAMGSTPTYAQVSAMGGSHDIILVSENLAGAGTSTAIASFINCGSVGTSGGFSAAANQAAILVADDGTNAYIWYINDALDGTAADLSSSDMVLIGTLSGTDVAAFTSTNFNTAIAG